MEKQRNRESARFIKALDEVKEKTGLSQTKIAKSIGYAGAANISNIRNGSNGVQIEQLRAFADIYGYDFQGFFSNEENSEMTSEVLESTPALESDIITQEIESIEKTNEMFMRLFETGIQLTKNNSLSCRKLRGMIGA